MRVDVPRTAAMTRAADAKGIASATSFLACPDASSVTGIALHANNGGLTLIGVFTRG